MSPNIEFDIELKEKCSQFDLKALIHVAGIFHNTKIDDLYNILQLFTENQIINDIYTMDDIKEEISFSRYLIYNEQTGIIINTLINYPSILFSIETYISKLKSMSS